MSVWDEFRRKDEKEGGGERLGTKRTTRILRRRPYDDKLSAIVERGHDDVVVRSFNVNMVSFKSYEKPLPSLEYSD